MSNETISVSRELSDDLAEFIAEKARVCGGGAYEIWEALCERFGQPADQGQSPLAVKQYGQDSTGHSDVEVTISSVTHYDHGPNVAEALARLACRVARFYKLEAPTLAPSAHAVSAQPDAEIPASLFCLPRFDMDQTACEIPDPDGVWVRYDDVAAFLQYQDKPLIHINAEKLAMLRGERKMEPGGLTFSLSEPLGGWTIPLYTRPAEQHQGEPVYMVRTHGSCCWEEVGSGSLEGFRSMPEEYELRALYTRPAEHPPTSTTGDKYKAELEALRKDAERYQWLRSRDLETISQGGVFAGITPENQVLNEETLDEAIDAARAHEVQP